MRINKMTDYAIRVVRAIHEAEEPIVTSKVIAKREQIPEGILMKVLNILRHEGIVESHQGRGALSGGFTLRKEPQDITLLNVIEIVQGEVCINRCLNGDSCPIECDCQIYEEFRRINTILRDELERYTMHDLLHREKVS